MKKLISTLLITLLLFTFIGCTSQSDESKKTQKKDDLEKVVEKEIDVTGRWLQTNAEDPILLTLKKDGSVKYYATLSNEATYTSTYKWNSPILTLNLVNIDNSGVTKVSYKADYKETASGSTLKLSIDTKNTKEKTDKLYGMEKILKGSYKRLSFSKSQLDKIKEKLNVPKSFDGKTKQTPAKYWNAGNCWIVNVTVYDKDGNIKASAGVNPLTMELCNNILQYSKN